jgi:hypothetical protein
MRASAVLLLLCQLIPGTLCWPARLAGQAVSGSIGGQVVDSSGVPLREVEVSVNSPSLLDARVTSTDTDGRFQLQALPVGTYRLAVRGIGYRPVAVENVSV